MKYLANVVLQCIKAESPGYRKGKTYVTVEQKGVVGLMGEDGFFDPLSQLVSSFKPADATQTALKLISDQRKKNVAST